MLRLIKHTRAYRFSITCAVFFSGPLFYVWLDLHTTKPPTTELSPVPGITPVMRASLVTLDARHAEQVEVTRRQIVDATVRNTQFAGDLAKLTDAQRKTYLGELGIHSVLEKRIPRTVPARSISDVRAIVEHPRYCTIDSNDTTLNRLKIEMAAMNLVLLLEQTRRLPTLSQADHQSFNEDIERLCEGARSGLQRSLPDLLPQDVVLQRTQQFKTMLLGTINDPTVYVMKQTFPDGEVEHLLDAFDKRLDALRQKVAKMLKEADEAAAQSNDLSGAGKSPQNRRSRVIAQIVDEALYQLRKAAFAATSPKGLIEFKPDEISPGYSHVLAQIVEREKDIHRRKRVRLMAQSFRAKAVELVAAPSDELLEASPRAAQSPPESQQNPRLDVMNMNKPDSPNEPSPDVPEEPPLHHQMPRDAKSHKSAYVLIVLAALILLSGVLALKKRPH